MRTKYFSAGRCPSVSGQGLRCGLPKGHGGEHCALTETDAPWFGQGPSNPEGHQWRECKEGEPREEGGVCVRCGAWATSEQFKPCVLSDVCVHGNEWPCEECADDEQADNLEAITQHASERERLVAAAEESLRLLHVRECIHNDATKEEKRHADVLLDLVRRCRHGT